MRPRCLKDQLYQYTVRLPGRLQEVEEFENLVIQVGEGGNLTRLKDVGRAELGSENYSFDVRSEENLAAGLLVYQLPGSKRSGCGHRRARAHGGTGE